MCRKLTCLVSFMLMLGVSGGITKADITSDLISYWKLDDGSGTTARDSAGVNDGTLKGALIDRWTQWSIPLVEFSNQGADLIRVKTITIGFGDKNSTQFGGTGSMYFDDIRLN